MSAPPVRHAASEVALADWRRLPAAERAAVRQLRISAEQHEFAGTIERSIAACEAGDPGEVAGLAIRADGDVVGWLLLKRGAAAPDWVDADAAVLGGLRVDQRCQGRGLGSLALSELPCWVARHWPQTMRLMLRVDEGNVAGIRAYERAGWREVGERRVGRVGPERTLALVL